MASPIPTQLSPGVKVSEIDLSQFIQPEAFNRGGMAGVFNWGPGLVATTVSSESQLADIFGKPTLDQFDTEGNTDFLAASNFLRYSSNLRVVRIVQDGDYNAVSLDPGITWIGSVTHATIKNEDEFRDLGGFSGNDGIEPVSFFKARYPGNFGNALGVIVFDGVTGETIVTGSGGGFRDYTLHSGYANTATMPGISYGTVGITFQARVFELVDSGETDPVTGETIFIPMIVSPDNANGGQTFQQVSWKMVTIDVPNSFENANEFITTYTSAGDDGPVGKFLYATGTTSDNRTLMQNGLNPDGNNANALPLRLWGDDRGRQYNPFHDFAIGPNPSYRGDFIRESSLSTPSNPKVDFLFWEFDNTNFLNNFRPGQTRTFGDSPQTGLSLGDRTIFAVLPFGVPTNAIPSNFQNSIFNVSTNLTEVSNNFPDPLTSKSFIEANRLWKYIKIWCGVANPMFGIPSNGLGWVNLIGATGPKTIRTLDADGNLSTATINFDATGGITGIRNNFANGIVQFGDKSGLVLTETSESYDSSVLFDKMPGTSEYASSVGGSNDEISVAVVDLEGKFGPRGSVLEKFELLSKATDAKSLDGQSIYYKDYINRNSRYVYCTKAFGFTGGGNANSVATTAFGDIYTTYNNGGNTYNRTGYYDASLFYGESSASAATDSEVIEGYSLFADDDNAADVIFLPESSVANDTETAYTAREQYIYDAVIEPRKDTILVIPTPPPASALQHTSFATNNAINFRKNTLSLPSNSYTILVAGRKLFFDTFNNQTRKMSLASDVAGILCAQEIPWESPAGFARGMLKNSIRLETKFTKNDRDELYKNQINFFTEFNDGSGTALYGDKTMLVKPSAFDRINVRRVFIAVEKAIARAAKYSLFEFNDEFTRAQFRDLITPYLRSIVAQRGISDFKIVCDETNNTADVIDRNQFVADIYIKPLKSINFIQLNFIAARSDLNLTIIE
jgi:hypothetical protein